MTVELGIVSTRLFVLVKELRNTYLGSLWLPGQFPKLLSKKLLVLDIKVLISEEDHTPLRYYSHKSVYRTATNKGEKYPSHTENSQVPELCVIVKDLAQLERRKLAADDSG